MNPQKTVYILFDQLASNKLVFELCFEALNSKVIMRRRRIFRHFAMVYKILYHV